MATMRSKYVPEEGLFEILLFNFEFFFYFISSCNCDELFSNSIKFNCRCYSS